MEYRLIQAARECFYDLGTDKTSMRDVADSAEVSRGTVYNYFPTKADLIRAVQNAALQDGTDEVNRAIAGITTLEEQLRATILMVLKLPAATSRPRRTRGSFASPALFVFESPDVFVRAVETFEPMFAAAIERGEARKDVDPRDAAEWFSRMLGSILSFPAETRRKRSPERIADFIIEPLLHGIMPCR